ncbi:paralemmin-3 [Nematolebias whitei]|uniref:paralemmin-3 n=1 Tax=Nematolebias whitei TaxID=451745 RepID=UPI0018990C06|nr:paralemmin-3 [Nematolebias whitei]
MDETEQYKQRLEAIAEKRRLQEEQDRARREQEDERLRQQQLKRKSLRDQWLMEGTPLSPTSPNTPSPPPSLRSTQDMDTPVNKLQSENRLAEEQQMEAVHLAEAATEKVQDLQNGQKEATRSEASDDDMKEIQSPAEDEAAALLTSAQGRLEANHDSNHSQLSVLNQNGPVHVFESGDGIKLVPEMSVTEAAPGPNITTDDETLVMRAEPVFITDDGPEELCSQDDQQDADRASLPHSESGQAAEESLEKVVTTETTPEPLPEPENHAACELSVEAPPTAKEKDNIKLSVNAEVPKTKVEALQSPACAAEGATRALVPRYTEVPASTLGPEAEVPTKHEASGTPVEKVKVEEPACHLGHFQEVPLTEPPEKQKNEADVSEQEPLLTKVQACTTSAGSAEPTTSPVSAETLSPAARSPGNETQTPKQETCRCCSVM